MSHDVSASQVRVWTYHGQQPGANYDHFICDAIAKHAIESLSAKQVVEELTSVLRMVRKLSPKIVIELGSAEGGSLHCWCAVSAPDAVLISVDKDNNERRAEYWAGWLRPDQTLHVVEGTTVGSYETVVKLLGDRQAEFLLIDAAHDYESVRNDFYMYSKLVSPYGVVMFHDTAINRPGLCGVYKFWNELKETHSAVYTFSEFVEWGKECGIGVMVKKISGEGASDARYPADTQ